MHTKETGREVRGAELVINYNASNPIKGQVPRPVTVLYVRKSDNFLACGRNVLARAL